MQDPQDAPAPRAELARTWRRYLRFFGARGIADLDDELRFHVEMRVRDYVAGGLTEHEARAATARRLGDFAAARNACVTITHRTQRRMTRIQLADALAQDVKFAARSLGRNTGWTAVAVLTLALGIGANAAMFSVVNHLLLNPIPYPDANRVVVVFQEPTMGNNTGMNVMITPMGRVVSAWLRSAKSFESIEPYYSSDVTLERTGEIPRVVHTAAIRPSFATFAGQRPIIGRVFTEREARGEASVVMLSEAMWRTAWGSDPATIGKTLTIDRKLLTIVGVMPGVFQLPHASDGDIDLWLPLDLQRSDDDGLLTIARLRRGVSRWAAARELDAISRPAEADGTTKAHYAVRLKGPQEMVSYKDSLLLLAGAVALVLLIACANVAHLLLARASTRQREMAIRTALGAGTERLFRQLLTESLMLSMAGCFTGLVVGWAGLRVLIASRPESLSDLSAARMDGTTLLVTAALAIVTGIVFGIMGAVQASRQSVQDALKAGSSATSAGQSHGRLRAVLVITEMALCTMLLIGAALLLRSVMHLQTRDPGFDPRGLYSLELRLPETRYKGIAPKAAFFNEFVDRTRRIPGVRSATIAASAPPATALLIGALQIEGQPDPPAGTTAFINYNGVLPDFFALMGMRLVEGTTFTDTTESAAQVVVNEGMARKYWPGQSALGHKLRVTYNGFGQWRTIVGVTANSFSRGLTTESSDPMLFTPGPGVFQPTVIVRAATDAKFLQAVTGIVTSIDAHLPPPRMTSVEDAMRKTIARPRFTLFLLMVFTVVAVGLAAIGLYGVLAYTVAQRTREIGIRMALGASRRVVARLVMTQGLVLAGIGAVLGLLAARGGAAVIGSMLYGVEKTDLVAFGAGAAMLVVIALLACLVPMRRALAVDPLIAMRAD